MPCPSGLVVKKGSKMRSARSAGTPGPSSATLTTTRPGAPGPVCTVMRPLPATAWVAFTMRFTTTCCSWFALPSVGAGARSRTTVTRPSRRLGWRMRSASSTTRARSTVPRSCSLGMREKRSSDSTMRFARMAASLMRRRLSWSSALRSSWAMICAKARMPPSGLLISWATPPASCPSADIFSVCTSRRVTSRSWVTSL